MVKHLIGAIVLLVVSCAIFDLAPEYRSYKRTGVKKTYKKYLIKNGFIQYKLFRKTDTLLCNVYFDDFGATEYLKISSGNDTKEFYKKDGAQYQKSTKGWSEKKTPRKADYIFEHLVIKKTSKLYNGTEMRKRNFSRFKKKKTLCFFAVNNKLTPRLSGQVNSYRGIPLGYRKGKKRILKAIQLDTSREFPLALKIK